MAPDNLVLVLVHGTKPQLLGRELLSPPVWAKPQSTFRTSLEAALSERPLFVEFEWSGANTHAARLTAGARLADRLRQLRGEHPKARLVVVAHSHGGNVACYALRQLAPASPEEPQAVDGVVFLGTPFLRTELRDLNLLLARLYVSLLYAVPVTFITLLLLVTLALPRNSAVAFNAFLVLFLGGLVLWKFAGAKLLDRWFLGEGARRLLAKARAMTAAVGCEPVSSMPPTLIVKSRRDEAKLWLTLVDRSASLLSGERLLRLTSRMIIASAELREWLERRKWSVLLPAALGVALVAQLAFGAQLKGGQAKRIVLAPLFLLALLSLMHSVVFIVVAALLRGSTLSFGQNLFLSLVASVTTSADLVGERCERHQALAVTLPPTVFHHASFYVDAATIRGIATWIDTAPIERRPPETALGGAALGLHASDRLPQGLGT